MSDRGDNITEANHQADSLRGEPAQGAAGRQERGEVDSSPHDLPMWSPIQRPSAGCFNMHYCLSIQVTLTNELGDAPSPSHSWATLVIEDML